VSTCAVGGHEHDHAPVCWFGLCAALVGAQPGCAHQLTNRDVALGAVAVGVVVGLAVLSGAATNCDLRGTCPTRLRSK
jgi:hypothetical protein